LWAYGSIALYGRIFAGKKHTTKTKFSTYGI